VVVQDVKEIREFSVLCISWRQPNAFVWFWKSG
jgi:hypothetical protein